MSIILKIVKNKQSPPSYQYQSTSRMTKLVCLNIGGKQFKVSCSLFDMHPNSLLAQSASEQWLSDPDEEIFLDQDGYRFRFVLDYLQNDGHIILPTTVPKPLFLADLAFYGIANVDESKIGCKHETPTQHLAHAVSAVHAAINTEITTKYAKISAKIYAKVNAKSNAEINAEIKALEIHCGIVSLAEECAKGYLTSRGKLKIDIHGPYTYLSEPKDKALLAQVNTVWLHYGSSQPHLLSNAIFINIKAEDISFIKLFLHSVICL